MNILLAISIALQLFNRGIDLYYQGKYREAAAAFTEAVRHDSKLWEAYRERAKCEEKLSINEKALEDVNTYIKSNGSDQSSLYLRLRIFLKLKKYDEALKDSDELLTMDPNDPYYIYSKALILEIMGKLEESSELFRKASGIFLDENLKRTSSIKGKIDKDAEILSSSKNLQERTSALQEINILLESENPIHISPAIPYIIKSFFYSQGIEWFLSKTILIEYSRKLPADRSWVWYLMDKEYENWKKGKNKKEKKKMLKELKNFFSLTGRRVKTKK